MALTFALALAACGDPSRTGLDDTVDGGGISDAGNPGDDGPPIAELPARVDLGAGDCGGTAAATFALTNRGGSALTYAFSSPDPRLEVSPPSGALAAGATVTVRVSAAVPAEVAAGEVYSGALVATTNAGDRAPRMIPVTFESRGATIAIDPPAIGIGQTAVGFPNARSFTVRNVGNTAAPVVIGQPGGEFGRRFGATGVVVLAPGEAATGDITYVPHDLGADTRAAAVTVTGAYCGARPPALALAGEGVPGDGVMVQGGPIDFGPVACGGGGDLLPIRLVNPSSIPVPFVAELLADPESDHLAFSVSQRLGTVPPNSTLVLGVRRLPISSPSLPRAYDAVLRITTTLGVASVTDVPVRQALKTARLEVSGPHDFGVIPFGETQILRMAITNTGNSVASLQATATARFGAILPLPILPGQTRNGFVSYTAGSHAETGRVFLSAVGACQAPLELQFEAGHGPFAVLEPAAVTATCPASPSLSTQLRVINQGDAPLEIACHEPAITSGLALQFSPARLRVEPHSIGAFTVGLAVGPLEPGAVTATVECTDNEPLLGTRVTTVTRTLVELEAGSCAGARSREALTDPAAIE